MDSINFYNIKAEKANAILRYNQLRKIANLFRFIEVLVVLILISRISIQLPHAVKNSGGYFRELSFFVVSPRFVFVLGNLIVIILFAKSGRFSGKRFSGDDIYEEFIKRSEKNQKIFPDQIRIEHSQKPITLENRLVDERKCDSSEIKSYTRSNSAILERPRKSNRQLRRSETQKIEGNFQSGEKVEKSLYPEDAMSNEEFRLKIESFIARQQRFRIEEEYSVI
ncbi:hypothetical protein UlMin_032783 [Ulmus minor]